MILIIAEKPSLARNIVAGIGEMRRRDGYYENAQYLVTWAFGHLFSLCDIEDYSAAGDALADTAAPSSGEPVAAKRRWSMDTIPCFPDRFKFTLRKEKDGSVDPGVARQFEIIRTLSLREDVRTIVNAGDADREGEIIVRLCISNAFGSNDGSLGSGAGMNDGSGADVNGGTAATPGASQTTSAEGPQADPAGASQAKPADVFGGREFKRLWLPDQTPETVRKALLELKSENEYDNLAGEGFARTYIDWLYGVNLTRYATIKSGRLLRVGRVIVPIVKAIYDRDMAIRYFIPEKYYSIASNEETGGVKIPLQSKLRFTKDEHGRAVRASEAYNNAGAVVTDKKTKKDTIKPGKLYSLSKLQNVLGKKYKMPMEQSLAIVQKLYEAGYLTYPRTNSEYLASAEKDKIKKIISNVAGLGYNVAFKDDRNVFDDKKIESHSAITPTYIIPDKSKLTEDEFKVYSTVMRRFAAVFCNEPCLAQKSEITVKAGNFEEFSLKGTVITQKGWTKYDDSGISDKLLPPLNKGDTVNIKFEPAEKETTPPKHYTIETLNNYLKNPFREEKAGLQKNKAGAANQTAGPNQTAVPNQAAALNQTAVLNLPAAEDDTDEQSEGYGVDDTEEYRMILEGLELGTEATRTGIINNAIQSKYIELKKDTYYLKDEGEFLIECISGMNISMDKHKTSELGRVLKRIYHGEMGIADGVALAESQIKEVFAKTGTAVPPEKDTEIGSVGDVVGKCPLCGKNVVRTFFGYGCEGYRDTGCKFSINLIICRRIISASNVRLLLETGKTSKIAGFTSKKGTQFDAALKLSEGKAVFDF